MMQLRREQTVWLIVVIWVAMTEVSARVLVSSEGQAADVPVAIPDWPAFRGADGRGTWQAPQLRRSHWADQLKVVWRQPIGPGYSGIAVAGGKVFTMDRLKDGQKERIGCWDARTGKPLWTFEYVADYKDLDYGKGPRATPLVSGNRVFAIGAVGHIHCLDSQSGQLIWARHAVDDFAGRQPTWGFAASPVIHDGKLVLHVGSATGTYVAVNPETGSVLWRAGSDECGYATPIVARRGQTDLLIGWTPQHVLGIDLSDGRVLWSIPYPVTYGVSIASPIVHDDIVLVSGYWEGTKAIRLGNLPTEATLLWEDSRHLRALMAQPLYRKGLVYLLDKQYGLTCFELATGRIRWTDQNRLTPAERNPHASIVWAGDNQILALNARGELVWAELLPDGYRELGRRAIVGPTWAHPAFCGPMIFARDDESLVAVLLDSER